MRPARSNCVARRRPCLNIVVSRCNDVLSFAAYSPYPLRSHVGLPGGETPHFGLSINSITECIHAGFSYRVSIVVWFGFISNYDPKKAFQMMRS